jgi:hemerythrin-like domain-containing protein
VTRIFVDFSTPAAGFDQPLELWGACHGRVRRMIGLLQRLAEHVRKAGADSDARTTATSIRRYFDEAAPRHHDDEELDLFVRLREHLGQLDATQAKQVADAIATLESDHLDLAALWRALREPLTRIEGGTAAELDEATIALFVSRYQAHMEIEETVIEPALKRLLRKSDLAAIGQAMAKRRGVDWSELAAR